MKLIIILLLLGYVPEITSNLDITKPVFFEKKSSDIKEKSLRMLTKKARKLLENSEVEMKINILVYVSDDDPLQLSEERGKTTARFFIDREIDVEEIYISDNFKKAARRVNQKKKLLRKMSRLREDRNVIIVFETKHSSFIRE